MIFNQFEFFLLFLPAVIATFFCIRPLSLRPWVLLLFSLLFYATSGIEHAVVLVYGILWVYAFTKGAGMTHAKGRLFLAITGPLLALAYYKYGGFFAEQISFFRPETTDGEFSLFNNILLPAGISFFTFQLIAYAVDRYRGDIPQAASLRDLALYISFFPQLVAGPIVRYSRVATAISFLDSWSPHRRDIVHAIGYIVFGLGIKVLLADSLSRYLAPLISAPDDLSSVSAVYVLFGYSFQIYFDFYGYSLIAIGLGRVFGFDLPENFLRPYESKNPKEFWRRWHVSLSFWIRDYLYLPLGGNRRYYLNIIIIFAVCGLWHGAGWTFVTWGLYHGALVIAYSATRSFWDKIPIICQRGLNFILVSFGWILFAFDFSGAASFFKGLLAFNSEIQGVPGIDAWAILAIACVVCFGPNFERIILQDNRGSASKAIYSACISGLIIVTVLFLDVSENFIYFRF